MDLISLVNIGADKVRVNSDLMRIYIEEYEKIFGSKPNCVSCSFKTDFNRLKDYVLNEKKNVPMKEITFKYKEPKGDILTYYKGDTPIRRYDTNLTEEFVIDYLTYGTDEELKQRKKQFTKLPNSITNESKSKSVRTTQKKGRVKQLREE